MSWNLLPSILRVILIAGLFVMPLEVSAHGGVSKVVGSAVVSLKQLPLSPLVGEKVVMVFDISDRELDALPNLPVTLTLTDTYYGDESKDQVILEKQFVTDANGNFTFDYTFLKENYFDVDVRFLDTVTKGEIETGFLIQSRETPDDSRSYSVAIAVAIGTALAFGRWGRQEKPL